MSRETKEFRPIHYLGNKSRFLDAIHAAVESVAKPDAVACDLFAGTAVVSRRLASTRPVLSADVQAYSSVLATALTKPRHFSIREIDHLLDCATERVRATQPLLQDLLVLEHKAEREPDADPGLLAGIIESGSLANDGPCGEDLLRAKSSARKDLALTDASLTWYYGGVYFSYQQALELDALRHAIRQVQGTERDPTAVASLMGVASDVVSTVGNHFAQPIQPRRTDGMLKRNWIPSVLRQRSQSVMSGFLSWIIRYSKLKPTPNTCDAIQADYVDTLANLRSEVGVIYADPPYTRDHYSRFYHVLETIALDDDPGVTQRPGDTLPSRGLYRKQRHQSPFSIRSQVLPAFQEVFSNAKRLGAPLVLSYSPMGVGTKARPETRLMSIDQLILLARDYFPSVKLLNMDSSSHSQFNRGELNAIRSDVGEVLIVASN